MIRLLDRVAVAATLLLPIFLVHGRALADICLSVVAILFLVRSAVARDWTWTSALWVRMVGAWWLWLVMCSARGGNTLAALAVIRLPLMAAALEIWVLRESWVRLWLERLLRAATLYIAAQCVLQFATGRNLFGLPRGADGELTGPYKNPAAGPPLSRLLYPALLPLARTKLLALLVLSAGILVMVMVGQRMPLLLTLLGLFTTALFLPRLRVPVLATLVAAGLLLAALPYVSPQAAHRIEDKFAAQMADLPDSHYGLLAARSLAMVRASPIFGFGFDAFRRRCDDSRFFHGWQDDAGGGAAICVQHPHSYYLQAAVEGGIPGLLLFAATAWTWLHAIARGLWRRPDRLRVGLFAAALIQLWPIASSTDWVSMPLAGWFFVQLGLALALARPYMPARQTPFEA